MVESFAEFNETLTLKVPSLGSGLSELLESSESGDHGYIVEVAAIHAGLTANYNFYGAEELEGALGSWVSPYPKPILLNHNVESCDPIGRVMAARMDKENDGTPFTRLQIAIKDAEAIQKIADQRYLTGSVGGKSEEALCSVCSANWAEASMFNLPCKHARGKTYKGKLAYLERKGLVFGEYSFVNTPADSRSGIRANTTETPAPEESWTAVARFFDLNMDKQEIVEYTESVKTDLLSGMRRKEALPLYLSTKGAFLSALAADDNEEQESVSVDPVAEESIEDILLVTESLSDDLADAAVADEEPESIEVDSDNPTDDEEGEEVGEEPVAEEPSEEELAVEDEDSSDATGEPEAAQETDVEVTDDPAEDADDSVEDEEENVEQIDEPELTDDFPEEPAEATNTGRRAQGQEKNRTKDVDPQSRMGTAYDTPKADPKGDKTRESDSDDEDLIESSSGDPGENLEELSVLESRIRQLEEENAKLRTALHRTLAERVVDTKIAVGLIEVSDREEELEEHVKRSASSLADSMRDLSKMSFTRKAGLVPTVESGALASSQEDDGKVKTLDDNEVEVEEKFDPLTEAESVFVDTLMGRRKL